MAPIALAALLSGCIFWGPSDDRDYADTTPKGPGCGSQLRVDDDGVAMQCFGELDPGITALPADDLTTLAICNTTLTRPLPLRRLTNLRALSLMRTKGELKLPPLSTLPHLEALDLTGYAPPKDTPVAEAFAFLAEARGLRRLRLRDTPFDDLRLIAGLRELEALDLTNAPIRDLSPLRSLPKLRRLVLHGTHVSDIRPLRALRGLEELDLARTGIRDVTPLARLTNLRRLQLEGNFFRDLEPLHGLTKLRTLGLRDVSVSHEATYALEQSVNAGRPDDQRLVADSAGHEHFGGSCKGGWD
ncbi:MAG: hypothetical protein R3B72_25900 [Polyangiaceae bacterium]